MELVDGSKGRHVLEELFAQARSGTGRAALVVGTPGMGKTTLIHHVRRHARALGAVVLSAVASRAERSLPMGVIDQLTVAAGGLPDTGGPRAPHIDGEPGGHGQAAAVHRFQALAQRLAEHQPLVVTVDDVHEIDAPSLESLLYLVRRVASTPVLVVLAERSLAPHAASALTAEFVRTPHCELLHLAGLSPAGAVSELAVRLGEEAARAAAPRWLHASGGSPLLLRALLQDRDAAAAAPDGPADRDDATPEAGPETAVAPVAGDAWELAVRYLLGQLDDDTLRTARGLAVLGDTAPPGDLERLLGLPVGSATRSLATLDALGLTANGRYRLDRTRTTALADMAPEERAVLHHRAARFLYEDGDTSGEVARHLVAGGRLSESWALSVLRDSAAQALRDNAPDWAITCLRVAKDACPDPESAASVRSELAQAEWEVDPGSVRRHLEALLDAHRCGRLDRRQSIRLIGYLLWHGRPAEADALFAALDGAEEELLEESLARLETMRVWFAHAYPALGSRYRHSAALEEMALGRSVGAVDPQADGALVLYTLMAEGPTVRVLQTAERLLQGVLLHDPPVAPAIAALATFMHAAQLDRAAEWCDQLVRSAERRAPTVRAFLAAASAAVESRLGNADVARRRADEALTLLPPASWGIAIGVPLAAKVLACTAQGDTEAAAECFRTPVPEAMFQTLPGLHYLQARGRYHLSVRRYHAALGDFHACRDLMAAWRLDVSTALSWRAYAAEALIALDSPAQARELLAEELTRQSTANRWMREESLRVLEQLGADASPDRPHLGRRSAPRAGAELSKAEGRVAVLASQGYTNREIAEKLFVTASTVEQHLTRAYQKLGVRGRAGLPSALAGRTASGA
ncbi:AAA family ATPase [Streptomyces gobitricini]|uniref:HTH luxR-type domain-containing protein n=1 Tax=Streptomyces gobitricini TaxID=68211 RepID=A0ABP5ZWV0_9ACTN